MYSQAWRLRCLGFGPAAACAQAPHWGPDGQATWRLRLHRRPRRDDPVASRHHRPGNRAAALHRLRMGRPDGPRLAASARVTARTWSELASTNFGNTRLRSPVTNSGLGSSEQNRWSTMWRLVLDLFAPAGWMPGDRRRRGGRGLRLQDWRARCFPGKPVPPRLPGLRGSPGPVWPGRR